MASSATWFSRGAWFLGLVIAWGCNGPKDRYPPPQPVDFSDLGGQGGAASGGSGGGGATTSGTPLNACECAYSGAFGTTGCTDCINAAGSSACKNQLSQCQFDSACAGLVNCPASTCNGKSGAALIQCVEACYAAPADQQAYQLFLDVMLCACEGCAAKCAVDTPLTCP